MDFLSERQEADERENERHYQCKEELFIINSCYHVKVEGEHPAYECYSVVEVFYSEEDPAYHREYECDEHAWDFAYLIIKFFKTHSF